MKMDPEMLDIISSKAITEFIAHTECYTDQVKIPSYINKANLNFSYDDWCNEFGDAVYRLLYSVYVENKEDIELVPETWWDHLKDTLLKKVPGLTGLFNINYRQIKKITKTFLPAEQVTSPLRKFNKPSRL